MNYGVVPSVNSQIQSLLMGSTADTNVLATGEDLRIPVLGVKKSYLLPAALGGVALLALVWWALRRRKAPAVAGYRRRKYR